MDPRERISDLQDVIKEAIQSHMQDVYTTAPVEILSFNPETWTCRARILTLVRREFPVNNSAGLPIPTVPQEPKDASTNYVWEEPTVLVDCPVVFLSGAGFTLFAPPVPGDEALAIFGCRSIDEWWSFGPPATRRQDLRTHSAADAFILAGVRSKPRAAKFPVLPLGAFTITNEDGSISIALDHNSVTITAPDVMFTGNLWVGGDISAQGDVFAERLGSGIRKPTPPPDEAGSISLERHVHTLAGNVISPPVPIPPSKDESPETGKGEPGGGT